MVRRSRRLGSIGKSEDEYVRLVRMVLEREGLDEIAWGSMSFHDSLLTSERYCGDTGNRALM